MNTNESGFFRLKHTLLTPEEWDKFFAISKTLTDEQLRFLRDEVVARESFEHTKTAAQPVFDSQLEISALLSASKHALPDWLLPYVERSWAHVCASTPKDTENKVELKALRHLLSIDWSNVPPLTFDYQAVASDLCTRFPGLEHTIYTILDHLLLHARAPESHMQPICLVGPPGTGKSSLIRALAECLKQPFEEIQMSCCDTLAGFVGSSKIYENASVGRFLSRVLHAKTPSFVLLLDEFDELFRRSKSSDGEKIALSLLQVLEEGVFMDEFFDIPFHLNTIFFLTVNDPSAIPEKVLQRFFIIEHDAYTKKQKVSIVHRLWNNIQMQYAFPTMMTDEAANEIVNRSKPAAGARYVRASCMTLAAKLALCDTLPDVLTADTVRAYVPNQSMLPNISNGIGKATIVGVSPDGVASCSTLIAICEDEESDGLSITGSVQDGTRESLETALRVSKWHTKRSGPLNLALQLGNLCSKKDGPSAGLAAVAALISLFLKVCIPAGYAFSGEVWLDGSIHAVGSLKAKAIGAEAAGCTHFFVPAENLASVSSELDDLNIKIIPVNNIDQFASLLFPAA